MDENLSGLVFDDQHFLCEECCNKYTDEEIYNLTESVMHEPGKGMPIALWLLHEQNKDKLMMSVKK
ncbi:MAG: hypothetical protein V5A64_03660 [Candidatus Thermoplasmatota archaeon]